MKMFAYDNLHSDILQKFHELSFPLYSHAHVGQQEIAKRVTDTAHSPLPMPTKSP